MKMEICSLASGSGVGVLCHTSSLKTASLPTTCFASCLSFSSLPSIEPQKSTSYRCSSSRNEYRSASLAARSVLQKALSSKNGHRSSTSSVLAAKFGTVPFVLFAPAWERIERRSGGARAYIEETNPVWKFVNNVRGALPIVGLISRLVSPEGGVGTDRVRFQEFCSRVGRSCPQEASKAFYEYQSRYGKVARPPYLLIWCWVAALGAGLLRSEDLLMGASRLRASYDIEFEVDNFDYLMDEATKKREKSGSKAPDVPMEMRAEKALEAICKCCTGRTDIAEEDGPLLSIILKVVFPTADKDAIDLAVASRLVDPFTADPSSMGDSQNKDEEEEPDEQSQDISSIGVVRGEEIADQQSKSVV